MHQTLKLLFGSHSIAPLVVVAFLSLYSSVFCAVEGDKRGLSEHDNGT